MGAGQTTTISLNRTLGVLSLVLAIVGAAGLIPIGQQWKRVSDYTTALKAVPNPEHMPPRPDPNAVGLLPIGIVLVELAALSAGGNVIERVGGRDDVEDASGLRPAVIGAIGACGVLLVLFAGALMFAFVGITTWW